MIYAQPYTTSLLLCLLRVKHNPEMDTTLFYATTKNVSFLLSSHKKSCNIGGITVEYFDRC